MQPLEAANTTVLSESLEAIRILTLNRPEKKNAANLDMQERLLACLEAVQADSDARVLILTGAGRAFSAGGDREYLRQIAAGQLDQQEALARVHSATIRCMLRLCIPVIAAVSGPAVGYAAGLVWIAIRLALPAEIERFAALARSSELAAAVAAPRNDDELERLIGVYTSTQDKLQLTGTLQAAGLEAFPAMTPPDLVADSHLAARGFFTELLVADRSCALPGTPLHGSRRLADPLGRAPRFNEHTSEILDWLDGRAS